MIVRAADNLAAGHAWTRCLAHPGRRAPRVHAIRPTEPTSRRPSTTGCLPGINGANGGSFATWTAGAKATRGEVAQMLWNLLGLMETERDVGRSGSRHPSPAPRHVARDGEPLRDEQDPDVRRQSPSREAPLCWEDSRLYEYDLAARQVVGPRPSPAASPPRDGGTRMAYCVSTGRSSSSGGTTSRWRPQRYCGRFDPTFRHLDRTASIRDTSSRSRHAT